MMQNNTPPLRCAALLCCWLMLLCMWCRELSLDRGASPQPNISVVTPEHHEHRPLSSRPGLLLAWGRAFSLSSISPSLPFP